MNATVLKALFLFVPAGALLSASLVVFLRGRTMFSFLQLLGAGCLMIVVLAHICEGLRLFPWMHWGDPHSVGHYLDLSSAVAGVTLLPMGYLLHRRERRARPSERN
jgi:succinate dehydrogenase/fumarate reductase cytochrome b subunit